MLLELLHLALPTVYRCNLVRNRVGFSGRQLRSQVLEAFIEVSDGYLCLVEFGLQLDYFLGLIDDLLLQMVGIHDYLLGRHLKMQELVLGLQSDQLVPSSS